jgi:YHS domain-containing protein
MMRMLLIGVLILLIARAFWRVMDGVIEATGGTPRSRAKRAEQQRAEAVKLVRDPICGVHLPPASAITLAVNGTTHYFCSDTCRDRFRRTA